MKRLAIVIAAVIIFTVAWSTAQSQAELNKKYAETDNRIASTQTQENKTEPVDTPDEPQQAEIVKDEQTPIITAKVAETPSKTPEYACGQQDPATIYSILTEIGVPRISAIQIMGSWKHESGGFDYCQKRGDGGIAWGLNSWHPARRYDMPETLREQINWAIHTEMKRDCASCYATIMAGGDVYSIRSAIQKSTRWGVLGNRWVFADQFASMF